MYIECFLAVMSIFIFDMNQKKNKEKGIPERTDMNRYEQIPEG
jgi:hypothetical protein